MLSILHDKLHVPSHSELRWDLHTAVEHAHEHTELGILNHTERVVAAGDPDNEAVAEMGLGVRQARHEADDGLCLWGLIQRAACMDVAEEVAGRILVYDTVEEDRMVAGMQHEHGYRQVYDS